MKTLLCAPSWIDDDYKFRRLTKWLDYYLPLKEKLLFHRILLIDNCSNPNYYIPYNECVKFLPTQEHLSRTAHTEYPYWYRAFNYAARYARENAYQKIIHIDTDMYLLNDKICEYIKNINSGWNTFWCPRHNFPESTLQVIGFDQLDNFEKFMSQNPVKYYGHDAENLLPFTNVIKDFKGDRFGEMRTPQDPTMDYYGQCPNDIPIVFNMEKK